MSHCNFSQLQVSTMPHGNHLAKRWVNDPLFAAELIGRDALAAKRELIQQANPYWRDVYPELVG
jgi:hypothetical protein